MWVSVHVLLLGGTWELVSSRLGLRTRENMTTLAALILQVKLLTLNPKTLNPPLVEPFLEP